jgi:GNAT superfamily N-acetyltransferase
MTEQRTAVPSLTIRPLLEGDVDAADHIVRLAFGTFLGLPDPLAFMGDADFAHTRWRAGNTAAFVAELDGEVVGSNFATRWGSVAFFGPLTVRPDLWDRGVAQRLLEPTVEQFKTWQAAHTGLFTFPQSTKHVHLYQKFGFWPRFLTPLMAKEVSPPEITPDWTRLSESSGAARGELLRACRELTVDVYPGLDLTQEIQSVADQKLGETVLLWHGGALAGFAVCHHGPGSEAGSGTCYVKFGTARPGAADDFGRLLDACEAFAAADGLARLEGGVNMSHHDAYRQMLARGFRPEMQGVIMQQDNDAGYHRPDIFLIDDWR